MSEAFDRLVDTVLKYKPPKERKPQKRKPKDAAAQEKKPEKAKKTG